MHTTLLLGIMALAVNAMETGHARRMPTASMPMITADPMDFLDQVEGLRRRDLHARQAVEVSTPIDLTVTLAPDATCGYLSAEVGVPITCTNGDQCAWAQLGGAIPGVVRCGTELKVLCYESTKAVDSALCNDACQSDTLNLLCTDSDTPYCRTYAFPDGVMDYRCASSSVEDVQSVEHTFFGQKNAKFTTRTANGVGAAESTEPETKADETSKETDGPFTVTQADASSTSSSNDKEERKSSVPLGAIIGGAVGGVALIGVILLGIFFMLRRRKNKTPPTEGPINPPTMNFAPQNFAPQNFPSQNMEPGMLDSKEVGTQHVQTGSAVSPLGSPGWGGPVSPPPVYEAPAHEAVQVHEMGDSSVTR